MRRNIEKMDSKRTRNAALGAKYTQINIRKNEITTLKSNPKMQLAILTMALSALPWLATALALAVT